VNAAPKTARGLRTRDALLAAARQEFEERGYADASVASITRRAAMSNGSFYSYFRDKEAVFLEIVSGVTEHLFSASRAPRGLDPWERIRIANQRYLDAYADEARLFQVIGEAAGVNPTVRQSWRDIRRRMIARTARGLRGLQGEGAVDADLDVHALGSVLGGAVEHAAYVLYFLEEGADRAAVEDALQLVWAQALGLEAPESE
jgi:AcrR family transcriptional regulator